MNDLVDGLALANKLEHGAAFRPGNYYLTKA